MDDIDEDTFLLDIPDELVSPSSNLKSEARDVKDKEDARPTEQIVMVGCWLAMKEVSLLGTIIRKIPLPVASSSVGEGTGDAAMDHPSSETDAVLDVNQLEVIGNHFLEVLLKMKHNGAIDKTRAGFTALCNRLLCSDDARLCQLTESWMEQLMERTITKGQTVDDLLPYYRGRPFLAALKPPRNYETIDSGLPKGFTERIHGRGIIDGGWVQQQQILQHPSVGCFITHCGIGSISEALASKCQVVMMPQAVDQFFNARMMSLEWKTGVEIEQRKTDGFFTKEAINKAVAAVMEEESEVGRVVRANHTKMRQFILKEGLEDYYISSFIQSLHQLVG